MTTPQTDFPLSYDNWYAARLFLEAGHPAADILRRLGIDVTAWRAINDLYSMLKYAGTSWVASAWARQGHRDPAHDRELMARLLAGGSVPAFAAPEPFSLRAVLNAVRQWVERDPHIGPFTDAEWTAVYLCERGFPTVRYVHDGQRVLCDGFPLRNSKGEPLDGIDPLTFRALGDRWFRDAARVYGQGETPTKLFWFVVRGAHADSFEVLNERHAADRAAGYYITNRRFPTADPGTFQVVGYHYGSGQKPGFHIKESHYAKDSSKVYAYGQVIEGAHAPSFEAIGSEGKYFADVHRIYWERTPIADADRASFQACGPGQYTAFDIHRPYWRGQPASVDQEFDHWSEFFEQNPEVEDSWWHRERARRARAGASMAGTKALTPLGGPYLSDGERVFVRISRRSEEEAAPVSLDHFDLPSFRHVVDVFAADRSGLRHVQPGYEEYGSPPIVGADPDSFGALGHGWYRDKRQAYFLDMHELRIVKADMGTFVYMDSVYARDAKGLIVEGVRKRDIADAADVRPLGGRYARQGAQILYRGKAIGRTGAVDVDTARGVHPDVLIDAQGHMLLGTRYRKPIGVDAASLRFLDPHFAVDDHHVYALEWDRFWRIDGVDRASFQVDGARQAHDARGVLRFDAQAREWKHVSGMNDAGSTDAHSRS